MTLAAFLEELKGIDPDTADDIGDIVNVISIMSDGSFSSDAYYPDFIIQGCIQRACERRGDWEVSIWWKDNKWVALIRLPGGYTDPHKVFAEESDSAAEALLAAYIAAVRASQ